jgi:hypothetical protein
VVSKSSIGFKVKAGRGIQTQEYFNVSIIESIGQTQELGLMKGFETTSNNYSRVIQ